MSTTRKMGSRRWEWAVAKASLDKIEKALCNGLVPYIDWDTGVAEVSMSTIAHDQGWSERALQKAATRLQALGVLSYPRGRRGGRRSDGRGVPNVTKLHLDTLESMKGEHRAPLKGEQDDEQGRIPIPTRVNGTTDKGEPGAHEQLREQLNPTTTTTTAGGGGGGDEVVFVGEEGAEQRRELPEGFRIDPDTSFKLLVGFGVTVSKARERVNRHAVEDIEGGIEWIGRKAKHASSPAGLLVTILNDGTAREEALRIAAERLDLMRMEQERLHRRRRDRYDEVVRAVQQWVADCPDRGSWEPKVARMLARMRHVWPSIDDLAHSGVLSDDELFDDTQSPRQLLNKMDVAATAEIKGSPPPTSQPEVLGFAPIANSQDEPNERDTTTDGLGELEA